MENEMEATLYRGYPKMIAILLLNYSDYQWYGLGLRVYMQITGQRLRLKFKV